MKELRCIVFTDREVLSAVIDRRRRLKEAVPEGTVTRISYDLEAGVRTMLHMEHNGENSVTVLPETEVQAALVAYVMAKNVPLPADSDKTLYVIKGAPTLMITMNFNKPARLISKGAAA
jgi:hypothetical protein